MTTPGDESRTELAWREIVENYGERPALDDEGRTEPQAAAPRTVEQDGPEDATDEPEEPAESDVVPAVDRFRPPPPPPFPTPRTWQRGVAWAGVLVSPALALLIGLFSIYTTPLVGWALIVWFVGGFFYLVRVMPRSPRDPWDDGSRI